VKEQRSKVRHRTTHKPIRSWCLRGAEVLFDACLLCASFYGTMFLLQAIEA
jgi:hypothetical protein